MTSSIPTTGFKQAFDNFLSGLIKASIGEGDIRLDQELIDPFHRIAVPSNASVPRKLVLLFEGTTQSIGIRLAPNVLYTLAALLIQLPYSHAGEKLMFNLLKTILLYRDASAAAKTLSDIAHKQPKDSIATELAKRIVTEDAVHDRRKYICEKLSLLSLKLICHKDKTKESRRLAVRVIIALLGVDHVTAHTIQQDPTCQQLGELLHNESDYVLRILVADLVRELLNTGFTSQDFLPKGFDSVRALAVPAEPHSHSLWVGEVLDMLSTIDSTGPISDSNDRVFKLRSLNISNGLHEDKAGNILAIFSSTINFLIPGGIQAPLQVIEVCTKNAHMMRLSADSTDFGDNTNVSGLVSITMPNGDGDCYMKGARKAVDMLQFGLANPGDVAALAQTLQHFSSTLSQATDLADIPRTKRHEAASEKQSIMFTDMTLHSESETSASDFEATSVVPGEMHDRAGHQTLPMVHHNSKQVLSNCKRLTGHESTEEHPVSNLVKLTGKRLRSLTKASELSPNISTPLQPSSDLVSFEVVSEQEIESPSLQASQGRVRRQEIKDRLATTTRKHEPAQTANGPRTDQDQSEQIESTSTSAILPKAELRSTNSRTPCNRIDRNEMRSTSNKPSTNSPKIGSMNVKSIQRTTNPAEPHTPARQLGSSSNSESDMARLTQGESLKLRSRTKRPIVELNEGNDKFETLKDIYDFEPGDEPSHPSKQSVTSLKGRPAKSKAAASHKQASNITSKPSKRNMKKGTSQSMSLSKNMKESNIKTMAATRSRRTTAMKANVYTEVVTDENELDQAGSNEKSASRTEHQHLQKLGGKHKVNTEVSPQAALMSGIDSSVTPLNQAQGRFPLDTLIISSTSPEPRSDQNATNRKISSPDEAELSRTARRDVGPVEGLAMQPNIATVVATTTVDKDLKQHDTSKDAFAEDSYPQTTDMVHKGNANPEAIFGSLLERYTQPQNPGTRAPATPFGNKQKFIEHVNHRRSASPQKSNSKQVEKPRDLQMDTLEAAEGYGVQPGDKLQKIPPGSKNMTTATTDGSILQKSHPQELEVTSDHSTNNIPPETDSTKVQQHGEKLQAPTISEQTLNHKSYIVPHSTEATYRESIDTTLSKVQLHYSCDAVDKARTTQDTEHNLGDEEGGISLCSHIDGSIMNADQSEKPELARPGIIQYSRDCSSIDTHTGPEHVSDEKLGPMLPNGSGSRRIATKIPLNKGRHQKIIAEPRPDLPQDLQATLPAQVLPEAVAVKNTKNASKHPAFSFQKINVPSNLPGKPLHGAERVVRFGPKGVINQVAESAQVRSRHSLPTSVYQVQQEPKSTIRTRQSAPVELTDTHKTLSVSTLDDNHSGDQTSAENSVSDFADDEGYTAAYEKCQDRTGRSQSSIVPSENAGRLFPNDTVNQEGSSLPSSTISREETSQSFEAVESEESLDSESVVEEDSEHIESQVEPKSSVSRTRLAQTRKLESHNESPQLSDADSSSSRRKPSLNNMSMPAERGPIGVTALVSRGNAVLGQSLGKILSTGQQEDMHVDNTNDPGMTLKSKAINIPSVMMPPKTMNTTGQLAYSDKQEEQLDKHKARSAIQVSDDLMPPPKRRKLLTEKKSLSPAPRSAAYTDKVPQEHSSKPLIPEMAFKPRRIKRKTDTCLTPHNSVAPIGTPLGFSTFLDVETGHSSQKDRSKPAQRTPDGQDVHDTTIVDPELTLVNDVPLFHQPIFNRDRQSEMTEETASSSEPESEGTPAPQHRRRQTGMNELNDMQQNVRTAILGIADSVLFRLDAEEDAVNAKLSIFQRGGQIALERFQEFTKGRVTHETEFVRKLIQAEKGGLQVISDKIQPEKPLSNEFSDIESVLAQVDAKRRNLIAHIDDIQV